MLDCEVGHRWRSNSAEASFLYAIAVGEYCSFWIFFGSIEEYRYAAVMPRGRYIIQTL